MHVRATKTIFKSTSTQAGTVPLLTFALPTSSGGIPILSWCYAICILSRTKPISTTRQLRVFGGTRMHAVQDKEYSDTERLEKLVVSLDLATKEEN